MSTVVQSVVAFRLTGSNSAVGFVVFAQGIAMFLLGPLGGAMADRLSKRRVLASCQLVTTLVFFGLAGVVALDAISVPWLALGSMLMGATFAFLGPTRQAFVVELVPDALRGNAVALSGVANNASRAVGPALAGGLLAWAFAGATGAYLVMGGLYALSLLTLRALPHSPPRSNVAATRVFEDIVAGFRYVRDRRRLRLLVLLFVLVIMLGFPHVTLLPGLVENVLGRPAESISLLFSASAVAALATSLVVARRADSPAAIRIFVGLGLGFGISLVLLALAPTFEIAILAMLLLGGAAGGFQALGMAVVLRQAEPEFAGRVMALTMMAFGGFGLVGLPLGILGDAFGERATLLGTAVAVCAVVLWLGLALARSPGVLERGRAGRAA
jgi:predicted MFS family arabinose efflux permease